MIWESLSPGQEIALLLVVVASLLWITEIIPLHITSFVILFVELVWLLPELKKVNSTLSSELFLAPFFSDTILLFLGGFVLAKAANKYGIDSRVARILLKSKSSNSFKVLLKIVFITSLLSMWMNNTATASLMIGLLMPVMNLVPSESHRPYPYPKSPWINFQRWNKVCFIHFEVEQRRLRELVPKELELDSHDGKFYVGVVPFEMDKVSLRGVPSIPVYSTFPELNVRTYVKYKGKTGVYFLSLDATRKLFVWGGQNFFHLPYHASKMEMTKEDSISYSSSRINDNGKTSFKAQYRPLGKPYESEKGSIEEFLVERYCLFVVKDGIVGTCDIDHKKWALYKADLKIEKNSFLDNLNLKIQDEPIVHYSESMDVKVWPLKWGNKKSPEG
jgi:uncharacterized protein YqjF (DUF2071 family)